MTEDIAHHSNLSLDTLFFCLAHRHRRQLLRFLSDRPSTSPALRQEELATSLAARQHEKPPEQVAPEERQHMGVDLHHVHIPQLESAELINYNPERGSVILSDHPALRDPGICEVLDGATHANPQSLDTLFTALADTRRRTILDILSHQYQQIHTETLTRELIARERGTTEQQVTAEETKPVLLSLRHVQLPFLHDTGLITYDTADQTVIYEGHPALRVPWMHSQLDETFRTSLTDSSNDSNQNVWTIEGRENIVSYGQSLCDKADEELFLMFTTTGLLEWGCFSRLKQATERGVDVYLGTQDPTAREFVEENASEVILWEPHVDWLNLPVKEGRVGRLVFADREEIMLGTLGEKNANGVHEERAMAGEGTENAFVIMMRQMLHTYLTQVDEQEEDIHIQLPF